jgi:hypothetical protein
MIVSYIVTSQFQKQVEIYSFYPSLAFKYIFFTSILFVTNYHQY